jgi:HEAT repeat protein
MSNFRELVEQLASPVNELREQARQELVQAGKAAVPALVDGLGNKERDVRAGAALCLGGMGFTGAAKVLAAMADADPDPTVRPLALRALADLASPEAPPAVKEALLRHLESADMFARALACQGLGRIGDADARAALQRALKDSESWVREAAHKALDVKSEPADPAAASPASESRSKAMVRTDTLDEAQLAQLLARLGSPDLAAQREAQAQLAAVGGAVVKPLSRLLWNEFSPARRSAIEVLGAVGGAAAMGQLVDIFLEPSAVELRAAALHAMARCLPGGAEIRSLFPSDEVRGLLERDRDSLVRAAAAAALVAAGGADRRMAVQRGLDDEDEWVRLSATKGLAEHADPGDRDLVTLLTARLDALSGDEDRDPTAAMFLLAALLGILEDAPPGSVTSTVRATSYFLHDEDAGVRQAAGELLTRIATRTEVDDATLTGLLDLLLDSDSEARLWFTRAVGRLARPTSQEAVDALVRVLHTADAGQGPAEAREAAQALVAVGGVKAIGALVEIANSRRGPVVATAAAALSTMDPRAGVVGVRRNDGTWEVKTQHFCDCGGQLDWLQREREELRCTTCDREYVLAAGGNLTAIDRVPLGTCACTACRRKQPLVRRPGSETLFCPVSGQVHVRPFDHPRQVRLLSDLPLGACSCCVEPQPLIRIDEVQSGGGIEQKVVCYRTKERYRPTPRGFVLQSAPAAAAEAEPADQIAAINEALLAGGIGIGQSGLATANTLERGEEPGGEDEDEDDRR